MGLYDLTSASDRRAIRENLDSTVDDDCVWLRSIVDDALRLIEGQEAHLLAFRSALEIAEPYLAKACAEGMESVVPVSRALERVTTALARARAILKTEV